MLDLDDLEDNIMKEENPQSTSDKFPLKKLNLPNFQGKVVSMSSSKKYLYFVTDIGELFRLKSKDLSCLNQAYKIRPESSKSSPQFKEQFTKVWTDKEGNHSIIRYKNSIYYFNSDSSVVKELKLLKENQIEVCSVGFDENNNNILKTGNILISDYKNNIYEYSITIDKMDRDDFSFHEKILILDSLIFPDWDNEEDDDLLNEYNPNNRIYGIKFYYNKYENKNNNCYIIIVTKNKIFQLRGTFENNSFKSIFDKYKNNHLLYNESCKFFPKGDINFGKKVQNFVDYDIDILYDNSNRFEKFGWKTQVGYCFGEYEYEDDYTPDDIKQCVVVPFVKINQKGKKEKDEPISIVHSIKHIFVLYKDCLTIISKITTNIIHTQYLKKTFNNLLYNKYSIDNGNLILISNEEGAFKISLEKENKDIWQDYLEIGNYDEAISICEKINPGLIKKIKRVSAEENFEKGRCYKAAKDFSISDEKFENVCILYLLKNDYKNLGKYLTEYSNKNYDTKKDILQLTLINFLLFNIHLKENPKINIYHENDLENINNDNNKLIEQNKYALEEFNNFIRENKDFLNQEAVYQMLQKNGRMEELIEYASIIQDYEKVILYYINEKNIPKAIHKLYQFSNSTNKEDILKKLCNIFQQNAYLLFKQCPKESINLLKEKFQKYANMEIIIRAIVSTTDKDDLNNESKIKIKDDDNEKEELEKKEIKTNNENEILSYLRYLIENKTKLEEEKNIHNLYIYYLSKSKSSQEELIEYLKSPLNKKENKYSTYKYKKEALFQLDYAKKLFRNNPEALSLVLALMGKYFEGVKLALKTNTKKSKEIAKFIASNAQGEKLQKKLWLDIFCDDKQNEKDPIKIMKESKILKIEDVLPYISDEIKIEEFKTQISKCINEYEDNINNLKEDINNYNKANETIINDIYKINKKSTEIKYGECKCDICQKVIKDRNLYLFPCGHVFDAFCIKNSLINYQKEGVNNQQLIEKNKKILELFKKLKIVDEKDKNREDENDKKDIMGMGQFFSKIISYGKEVVKKQDQSNEKLTNKEIEEGLNELNNLLTEQCVLCGEYMIENVQNSLIDENKDFIEWAYI